MKKIGLLSLLLLFSSSIFAAKETIKISSTANSVSVVSATNSKVRIKVNIGSFQREPISINGSTYYKVDLGEGMSYDKSYPELPKIVRSLASSKDAKFTTKVISSSYKEYSMQVVPSKGILSRNIDPNTVGYTFSSAYTNDSYYPSSRFATGSSYSIRDVNGTPVTIYPFAYNGSKKKLRVYTSLEIEYTITNGSFGVTSTRSNSSFDEIYRGRFINYSSIANRSTSNDFGSMLIICHSSFVSTMTPYVTHKNEIGIPTTIVSTSTTGTSYSSVKNYINNYYANHPNLTYVLLVGDYEQIQAATVTDEDGTHALDPKYSLITADKYPDIIVGRFSVSNTTDLNALITKSILYDGLDRNQAWAKTCVGIASAEGPGHNGEYDYQHSRIIGNKLLNWEYDSMKELYDGSQGGYDASGNPTATDVVNTVNNGCSIINYTGHGHYTFWGTSGFSVNYMSSLTNTNKWPFIFDVACLNGDFKGRTCFAESWQNARNSSGYPTGSVCIYASSISQPWQPPMRAQDAFADYLIDETYSSFGCLCYNASCVMMDEYSGYEYVFDAWNIFGDPSIRLIPHDQCPSNLTIGTNITGGVYKVTAENSIVATNRITGNSNTLYSANRVRLKPGFYIKGSHLEVNTLGCSQSTMRSKTIYDPIEDEEVSDYQEIIEETVDIKLIPNPTTGEFSIYFGNESEEGNSVTITDMMGKVVYSADNLGSEVSINLNDNSKGIYIVKAIANNNVHTEKLILK
ncbi:MAG: T9SS type A sorting domain-containing protein [Paludibacteraceae bacterium]|nr:T9SS type A sorting domain-containing protein [Paludibacteraceae bacterium]